RRQHADPRRSSAQDGSSSARPDTVGPAGRSDRRVPERADGNLPRRPPHRSKTMKLMPATAAVPIVLVLLTWLSFRASNTDAERFDRALSALDRFALVESALQRDVLSARAGMLRNYDPLVREVNVLNELISRLRDAASADAEEAAAVDRLFACVSSKRGIAQEVQK